MKKLSLSFRVYLLLGCALLGVGAASIWLLARSTSVSAQSAALIQQTTDQAHQAGFLLATFKKQSQAWQVILRTGKDNASLERYTAQFHTISAQLDQDAAALAPLLQNQQARTDLESFREQHDSQNSQYEQALLQYTVDRDSARAAAAVQGQDRIPADQLARVEARLIALANRAPLDEAARLRHQQAVLQTILLFTGVTFALWSIRFARSLGLSFAGAARFVRTLAPAHRPISKPKPQQPRPRHRAI